MKLWLFDIGRQSTDYSVLIRKGNHTVKRFNFTDSQWVRSVLLFLVFPPYVVLFLLFRFVTNNFSVLMTVERDVKSTTKTFFTVYSSPFQFISVGYIA